MKICARCGKKNSNNSLYCEQCGKSLNGDKNSSSKSCKILYFALFAISLVLILGGIILIVYQEKSENVAVEGSGGKKQNQNIENSNEDESNNDREELIENTNAAQNFETSENAEPENGENIYYFREHTYVVYDQSISWSSASAACEYAGGHLVTIQDEDEEEFVKSIIGNKAFYWLGGYKDEEDNSWKWITNELWEYTDWSPGQPDNYSAVDEAPQGYLVFSTSFDAWDDQQEKGASQGPTSVAEGAAGYICEWDEMR